EAIDRHRVDVDAIDAHVTLVAIAEDQLVPVAQLQALDQQLGERSELVVLRSRYGHDAFLKEADQINPILRRALAADGVSR
nr:homoserine O-succinyltransferase [Planctomycetota bacterium]